MGRHNTKGNSAFRFLLFLFGLVDFVHWITTVCTSFERKQRPQKIHMLIYLPSCPWWEKVQWCF